MEIFFQCWSCFSIFLFFLCSTSCFLFQSVAPTLLFQTNWSSCPNLSKNLNAFLFLVCLFLSTCIPNKNPWKYGLNSLISLSSNVATSVWPAYIIHCDQTYFLIPTTLNGTLNSFGMLTYSFISLYLMLQGKMITNNRCSIQFLISIAENSI